MGDILHICMATDDNYAQQTCACISSILANNNNICIHLLETELSNSAINKINNFVTANNSQIYFYHLNNNKTNTLIIRDNDHVTHTVYLRIFAAEVINKNIDKILYLDSDTIVTNNIHDLYGTNISGVPLAAVPCAVSNHRKLSLEMDITDVYFNSGVILMNLDMWRQNNYIPQIINFIKTKYDIIQRWDQDALNAIFCKNYMRLHLKYNVYQNIFSKSPYENSQTDSFHIFTMSEINEAMNDPHIIHYTGTGYNKPWSTDSISLKKNEYIKYLNLTPYKAY